MELLAIEGNQSLWSFTSELGDGLCKASFQPCQILNL